MRSQLEAPRGNARRFFLWAERLGMSSVNEVEAFVRRGRGTRLVTSSTPDAFGLAGARTV
jgi:hypothetical protein